MKILVINSGSSSVKYQLFFMDTSEVLASGLVERIGEEEGYIKHKNYPDSVLEKVFEVKEKISTHKIALEKVIHLLMDTGSAVITDKKEISAIGHRVVHGGEAFHQPTIITSEVIAAIKEHIPLAPLHNPANLSGILACSENFSSTPQIAVFDTAFHQTIPKTAYMYAIEYGLYEKHKVRKYGFHGTSHKYVCEKAAHFLGKPFSDTHLISMHLGNGASVTAVKKGKSVDTSMGMTPLEGLIMGTRSGDMDPGILFYLSRELNMDIDQLDKLLNKNSGLKGISGTNDMRDLIALMKSGDAKAKLAFEMYCYRIKKYIGSYLAVLGELDAIVFTGGIGENSPEVRSEVCLGLENLGLVLDPEKNQLREKTIRSISVAGSKAQILIVPTNEELEIALSCKEVLK